MSEAELREEPLKPAAELPTAETNAGVPITDLTTALSMFPPITPLPRRPPTSRSLRSNPGSSATVTPSRTERSRPLVVPVVPLASTTTRTVQPEVTLPPRPRSPRDPTPLIVEGVVVDRSQIPPILPLPEPASSPNLLSFQTPPPPPVARIPPLQLPVLPAAAPVRPAPALQTIEDRAAVTSPAPPAQLMLPEPLRTTPPEPLKLKAPAQPLPSYGSQVTVEPVVRQQVTVEPVVRQQVTVEPIKARASAPVPAPAQVTVEPIRTFQAPLPPSVPQTATPVKRVQPQVQPQVQEQPRVQPQPQPQEQARVQPQPQVQEPPPRRPEPEIKLRSEPEAQPAPRKKRNKNRPDYEGMSKKEQAIAREDFRVKFRILKRSFPNFTIPEPEGDEDLDTIHMRYDKYVHFIHVNSNADQYKVYLIILFMAIELFCCRVLHLGMGGFTLNQLSAMSRYERLLVELGERNYSVGTSAWPVEIRILVIALVNGIIFFMIKSFSQYLGPEIGNVIQNIVTKLMNGNQDRIDPSGNVQAPPAPSGGGGLGGLDLGSLLGGLGGLLGGMGGGGGGAKAEPQTETRRPRRPAYTE